jgi:archaellum component FlaC
MSDVTSGSIFNPQFFMNPPWWLGRVEEKETWVDNIKGETFTNVADIQGWGHRYKVRIFNWHTGDLNTLPPEEMAFCQVVLPVTAGSGHGGAAQTPSIESGSVVFGFFMDGMAGQEGYIVGVIGNSNNNVPKERGKPSPNQPQPAPNGRTSTTPPPTKPASGNNTGTALNKPLPTNIDNASTETLKRYLDPSKTPSSAVFKAATEARQKAKAAGLSPQEIERQVLIATVKASKGPNSDAGTTGNCNQGYQQFNNTYSDSSKAPALVPDFLTVGNNPLSTVDAVHVESKSWTDQDEDRKRKQALLSACKKKNTETKGIQRTIKNLINDVEKLKKEVGAINSKVQEITGQVQSLISGASEEISKYIKTIIGGVRGYILSEVSKKTKEILPFLFPTDIPKFNQLIEEGSQSISCAFNNIIKGLKNLIGNLLTNLLDKVINVALCVVENFLSNILDNVLGPIMDSINAALDPIFALVGGITGAVSGALGIAGSVGSFGSVFDALDFSSGISKFFKCDDDIKCPDYDEISLGNAVATPGGDATKASLGSESATTSSTGTGQGDTSTNVSASITKNTSAEGNAVVQAEKEAIRQTLEL